MLEIFKNDDTFLSINKTFTFVQNILKNDINTGLSEDEQILINLLKEKLNIGKELDSKIGQELAINFIKFDEEFKNLNIKTYKFTPKEIEQIINDIKKYKKLKDNNIKNILGIDDDFSIDDTALKEIRAKIKKN